MNIKYYVIAGLFLLLASSFVAAGDVIVKNGELNVTQNFIADTNTLYVDSANNRVGIGTASPSDLLDVNSLLLVKSTGNVGIGTTNPGALLEVYGSSATYRITNSASGNKQWDIGFGAGGNNLAFSEVGVGSHVYFAAGGNVGVGYADPGTAKLAINGNVGIGTTSPNSTLHIVAGGTTLASSWDVYSDPNIKANLAEQNINNFDFSTAKLYSYNLKWSESNPIYDENGTIISENAVDKVSNRTQLGLASTDVPNQCVRNTGGYDAVDTYCLLSLAYVKIAQLENRIAVLEAA